jgi:DNA-directed RNA polymerase III subunit RPC3
LIYCVDDFWLHGLTNLSFLQTVEEVISLEQKIVNTATLSEPERFSEIPYSMEDASNANDCPRNAVCGAKVF